MTIIDTIASYIIPIILCYNVYAVPKLTSEYRGLRQEDVFDGYGNKTGEKIWKHGINMTHLVIALFTAIPLLIFIQQEVEALLGVVVSAVVLFIITIPIHVYGRRKTKENIEELSKKPKEEKPIKLENQGLIGAMSYMYKESKKEKENK